jgi:hypothetical protein
MGLSSASIPKKQGPGIVFAALLAVCLLAHTAQVVAAVEPSPMLKRIIDATTLNRAVAAVLDRLSIGNVGGLIKSVQDLDNPISGVCQNQRAGFRFCADEALELRVVRDTRDRAKLNFK